MEPVTENKNKKVLAAVNLAKFHQPKVGHRVVNTGQFILMISQWLNESCERKEVQKVSSCWS